MAKIKISALPSATGLDPTDLLTAVSSSVSTKITITNLSNSLTQVSSSISASYALTASYATTSSYAENGGVTSIIAGTGISIDTSTGNVTITNTGGGGGGGSSGTSGTAGSSGSSGTSGQNGSSGTSGQNGSSGTSGQNGSSGTSGQNGSSGTSGIGAFPYTGSAQITGSLGITGSVTFISGSLAVGNITGSSTIGRIDASNDVVAFSTSDLRLKTEVSLIQDPITKVNMINGVNFTWIENPEVHGNSGRDVGVIAQEIEAVLPEVVTTRDNGYKAVKYEKIVPLLIEAIKQLQKQIDELKNK